MDQEETPRRVAEREAASAATSSTAATAASLEPSSIGTSRAIAAPPGLTGRLSVQTGRSIITSGTEVSIRAPSERQQHTSRTNWSSASMGRQDAEVTGEAQHRDSVADLLARKERIQSQVTCH